MRKPIAKFIALNGGGSYKLEIHLTKKATENQNAWDKWAKVEGNGVVWDYQLNGVKADLVRDGFKVVVV